VAERVRRRLRSAFISSNVIVCVVSTLSKLPREP
jgi:hypothetical protein